jgi:hypothetical protein
MTRAQAEKLTALQRVEIELSNERSSGRELPTLVSRPSPGVRLWLRILENSVVMWPIAYGGALIWLGMGLTRGGTLDFAVIAFWCLLGTFGLVNYVRRSRHRPLHGGAGDETESDAVEAGGERRSDVR